jgi:hypothetical protein
MSKESITVIYDANNVRFEKCELYSDFVQSLLLMAFETYMGDEVTSLEQQTNHFKWCWNKVVDNFQKENIRFNKKGEHFDYFISFFQEIFYKQENKKVRDSVSGFFDELFDIKKPFTKSDLDMINSLYKGLDKNMNK